MRQVSLHWGTSRRTKQSNREWGKAVDLRLDRYGLQIEISIAENSCPKYAESDPRMLKASSRLLCCALWTLSHLSVLKTSQSLRDAEVLPSTISRTEADWYECSHRHTRTCFLACDLQYCDSGASLWCLESYWDQTHDAWPPVCCLWSMWCSKHHPQSCLLWTVSHSWTRMSGLRSTTLYSWSVASLCFWRHTRR